MHLKIDIQMLDGKGRWNVIMTFVFMTVSSQSNPEQGHSNIFLLFNIKIKLPCSTSHHFTGKEYELL